MSVSETIVLEAVRDCLQTDVQSGDLLSEDIAWVEISEGGEIEAATPVPCIAIESSSIVRTPRTMNGQSTWAEMMVIVHVYLNLADRTGPESGSLKIKRISDRIHALLFRNKLSLAVQFPLTGTVTYPPFGQRNYTDRREGRIPVTYRWVES